jgi:hypothetical protein
MSVENLKTIDVVSIDLNGNAVLTISDHLEWDANNKHLLILQDKINAYLSSIEEGDLYESYPNAKDRNIVINIAAKYSPNKEGEVFLKKIKEILEAAGYGFHFSLINA